MSVRPFSSVWTPPPPGAARLTGRAVDLIEGLSFRAPLTADVADADRWLLSGLDAAFDVA
jgi:hypothetical protein